MRRVSLRRSPLLRRHNWPGLVSGATPLPLPPQRILPTALPCLAHRLARSCTPLPLLPLVARPRKPRSGQITLPSPRSVRPSRALRPMADELPSPSLPSLPSPLSPSPPFPEYTTMAFTPLSLPPSHYTLRLPGCASLLFTICG